MIGEVGDLHSSGQDFLEHDLTNFVDITNQDWIRRIFVGLDVESSVDIETVGSEVAVPVDIGIVSTAEVVEGSADNMQQFLDKVFMWTFVCRSEQ